MVILALEALVLLITRSHWRGYNMDGCSRSSEISEMNSSFLFLLLIRGGLEEKLKFQMGIPESWR